MGIGRKFLGAALIAAVAPWFVIPAAAAPLSESAALSSAAPASAEPVHQRNRRDRAAARRRSGSAAPARRDSGGLTDFDNAPWGVLCSGEGKARSSNPSWACPPWRPY